MNQAQIKAVEDAKKENAIAKEALLEELKLAINDYFVAQIQKEEDGISMRFPNGQEFIIHVHER